jgi:hypothetical protein
LTSLPAGDRQEDRRTLGRQAGFVAGLYVQQAALHVAVGLLLYPLFAR